MTVQNIFHHARSYSHIIKLKAQEEKIISSFMLRLWGCGQEEVEHKTRTNTHIQSVHGSRRKLGAGQFAVHCGWPTIHDCACIFQKADTLLVTGKPQLCADEWHP